MKEFRLQPKILFGEDSLEYLKTLKYKKVMIITDEVITQLKLVDLVTNNLSPMTEVKIFDKVEPNPSIITIENGLKDFIDFEPQCVIALGGGSSIDACKGILYFAYKLYKELDKDNKKIFFIAIPTTSGTGSEVTSYSVVTQGEHKIALANDLMLPDVALLSTKFLGALPAKVVADTGMDVLTHSLEAYVSTNANPFSSSLAMKSIKLIFENLVTHYNDRKIEGPKENVQFASCMAGIAFDNSSLGINHSIAHSIGAKFHIAHGRANAIIMPYVIEVNTEANKRYYEISKELGLPADTIEEGKSSLLSFVRILKEKLDIEKCLKDYGVDFEDFKREIPSMLLDIKKDICTEYNPNKLTDEGYIRLLLKVYFGE
ncbi:1-propanol dehydrogenase PduQ [Fusobacterium sp. 1001295B_180824_G3]|uniref:1-propanol dehydrogenase PduQ n=1 Tax=Fusobacterium sp. 1001295B_180824_G3 TaxID=2787123 RepID=UPI00189700D7|nr:1-propanol dehydrogenase PduQ [Fusobacterium sp. 1001295B_180824_G3]